MAATSVSRWWYGIAGTILVGALLYAFAGTFLLLGPREPAGSDGELVLTAVSLAATAAMALALYVMTGIYTLSFVLDWWHVSTSDRVGWSPSRWYLLIPLAALGNGITPVIAAPVMTAGGGYYLLQRGRATGTPDASWLGRS